MFVGTVRSGVNKRVQEKEGRSGDGGGGRAQVKKEERYCSDGGDGDGRSETEIAIKYITGEK